MSSSVSAKEVVGASLRPRMKKLITKRQPHKMIGLLDLVHMLYIVADFRL